MNFTSNTGPTRVDPFAFGDAEKSWAGHVPGSRLRVLYQNCPEGYEWRDAPPFEVPPGLPGNWFTALETNYVITGCWHSYCPSVYDRRNVGPCFIDDVRPTDSTDWTHLIEPNTEIICVQPITATYGSYERDTHQLAEGETLTLRPDTEAVVLNGAVELDGEVYESPAHIKADAHTNITAVRGTALTTFWFKGKPA